MAPAPEINTFTSVEPNASGDKGATDRTTNADEVDRFSEKKTGFKTLTTKSLDMFSGSEAEEAPLQEGVKQMEAITSAWTFKALVVVYIFIYICSYNYSMLQRINSNLEPYVTSSFSKHGLTATTGVMASIFAGASRLPLAKIVNIWGRVEGFILVNLLCSFGLLLMAVCPNVETYAAAQVFGALGGTGIGYIIFVIISDTTSLRNRMIVLGLNSTTYIANSFAGPAIAQLFIEHSSFRWAFGAFAIITPLFAIPIILILWWHFRKAKLNSLYPEKTKSGRNWKQSSVYYWKEFDVIGMLLIILGFGLVLLPLSLASYSLNRYKSPHIITMIILGVFFLAMFAIWERMYASVPIIPWKFLKDRTILGACGLACFIFIATSSWDSYFSSYLQVVHGLNIRDAGFILNIYNIASYTWGPIVGLLIRQIGRYKWIALCAVPISALGMVLLIHFRQPGTEIGYIVMTQVFKAISSGTLIICEELAAMAVVPHNEVAVMIAVLGLFSPIGDGVGRSISGAIWTSQLPSALRKYLPPSVGANATEVANIYGSLPVQLTYEWGSAERVAIVSAYGEVQRKMLITGVSFLPLALGSVLFWRDVNVKGLEQTKGRVF